MPLPQIPISASSLAALVSFAIIAGVALAIVFQNLGDLSSVSPAIISGLTLA